MQEQQEVTMQDNLQKPKLPKMGQLTPEQRQKVDRLAELKAELTKVEPLTKEADAIRKELVGVADLHFADSEQAVLKGDHHSVLFSPKTELRKIEDLNGLIGKLKDKVGYEVLISMLKLTLADVDKYLTPEESAQYLGKMKGTRTFKGFV